MDPKQKTNFRFTNSPATPMSNSIFNGSVEIPDFILWVKEEPFLVGIVSPTPSVKIGVNVLRKVAEYCREKDGYYPEMSLLHWGHISKYKLQLPIELSWTFLRLFDIISKPLDINTNLEIKDAWDLKCEEIRLCAVDHMDEIKVDTLKFLILIFIQNHTRLHRKYYSRTPSVDDSWPAATPNNNLSDNKSNSKSPQRSLPLSPVSNKANSKSSNAGPSGSTSVKKRKLIPEQVQIEFLVSNLEDIVDFLDLVLKPKHFETGGQGRRISVKIVEALSFILGAASYGSLHDREFGSLQECLEELPEVACAVDYDKETGSVDKLRFVVWVQTNVNLNPWGPSSAPVPQKEVDCVTGIWYRTKAYELNRIFWNTQLYPKGWYLISSVNNQVVCLDSLKPLSSVKIHRCSDSYIYLPCVFNSVIVEKCHNTTIFLGPVGKVVKFVDCSNLTVSAVGRVFMFCGIVKSTFHILTPCQPVISGNKNRKITLGPYNTFYPKLEEHMDMVGLGVTVQKWNKPMELESHGVPLTKSQTPNYALMRIENFNKLIFPFEMDGQTDKNPVNLPRNYAKKLKDVEAKAKSFKLDVKAMNFTDEKKAQLSAIVNARFHSWLKEQGYYNELKGLRSIQKSIKAGSSVPILDMSKSAKVSNPQQFEATINGNDVNNSGPKVSTDSTSSSPKLENGNRSSSVSSSISFFSSIGGSRSSNGDGGEGGIGDIHKNLKGRSEVNNSEADDDVLVYEGDDFNRLDSVFLSDDEDTDGFDLEEDELERSFETIGANNDGDICINGLFQTIEMDDGLLWSPI